MRFVFEEQAHPRFRRRGMDLATTLTISLREALLGFNRTVAHLDGHPVWVASRTVTQHGGLLVVQNEGMVSEHRRGRLEVTLLVELPAGRHSSTRVSQILSRNGP